MEIYAYLVNSPVLKVYWMMVEILELSLNSGVQHKETLNVV